MEYTLNFLTPNYIVDYIYSKLRSEVHKNVPHVMAQSANRSKMEAAHLKIETKITLIKGFIQRHRTVGGFCSKRRAEAGELRWKLENQIWYLRILWYAEPDEVKFEELSDWIAEVEDKVKRTLNDMEVFMKVREMRLLTEHHAGVKTITDPAGVDVVLQDMEATTNTQTKLEADGCLSRRNASSL